MFSLFGGLKLLIYLTMKGMNLLIVQSRALHRTVTISSVSLDSLTQGGYVVTTIRSIAGETYKDAYPAFCGAMTIIVPAIGAALAVILFSLGL